MQFFDQNRGKKADRDDRAAKAGQSGKAEAERHETHDVPDEEENGRQESRAPEVRRPRVRNVPSSFKRRHRFRPRPPHGDGEQERRVERKDDASHRPRVAGDEPDRRRSVVSTPPPEEDGQSSQGGNAERRVDPVDGKCLEERAGQECLGEEQQQIRSDEDAENAAADPAPDKPHQKNEREEEREKHRTRGGEAPIERRHGTASEHQTPPHGAEKNAAEEKQRHRHPDAKKGEKEEEDDAFHCGRGRGQC